MRQLTYEAIFIPGNVPSSKNSKTWTGKYLVWSKKAQQYVKETTDSWKWFERNFKAQSEKFEFPLRVSFKFYRDSRHKFDYVNPLQTVLDLMVKFEWIEDDNADIILPVFEQYEYDKENPGVLITVLNNKL